MKGLKVKLKRQIEILGLVFAHQEKYTLYDFEKMYNVDDLTIKRDLQKLRSYGIDIHSKGKKGIDVYSKIPDEVLKGIILHFIGNAVDKSSYDQTTNLFIRKFGTKSISTLTQLQICIDQSFMAKILYQRPEEKTPDERIVEPYCIFQGEKNWRLLANHNGKVKQFLLNNIKSV